MDINTYIIKSRIKKKVFTPAPLRKHGLVLQVHHTVNSNHQKQQKIRFIHANFDRTGYILVAGDQVGNIFLIDILRNRFWVLPSTIPCTALKFSHFNNVELIVGKSNGNVNVLNAENGEATGELVSHKQAVTDICFSHDYMCLTSSKYEAILWDLRSNSKVQVLNIGPANQLKLILFMPITSDILACFDDDVVVVWKYQTFEIFKEIKQAQLNGRQLRSIAFSRNGRVMVFSGYFSHLTVFALDTWTEISTIDLPLYIQAIKFIDFIPQLFDGGSNKILGILASNGILYFYDMEECNIVNKVEVDEEIIKFDCSHDGQHIACTLKSGEVNIYKIGYYVPSKSSFDKADRNKFRHSSSIGEPATKRNVSLLSFVQEQIRSILDIDKLRAILNEFGQYPDSYRIKIWSQILELPNNTHQYNTFINLSTQTSFEDLEKAYPLENKAALKNLKRLLANLVTWSPFFAQVSYLPILVFPFVRVFQNEPILCFEAMSTIIVNWCQHWFEYFPLPPINILAMIENLLLEHDPELLNFFTSINITSKVYAWPLLESVFSEVLTPADWCKLWDHILTNEPSFFLMCVTAYSILHRQTLSKMNEGKEFEIFYHSQNVIDVKRLISKSYTLLNNTSRNNHPRQYLRTFTKIETGSYPHFLGFPRVSIDIGYSEIDNLRKEQLRMKKEEEEILKLRELEHREIMNLQKQEEEKTRLKELEKVCRQKIQNERERVKEQRRRLVELRNRLHQEEIAILNKSRQDIVDRNINERKKALEKILNEVEQSRVTEELEVTKAETDLVKHYSQLLHHKMCLEKALNLQHCSGPNVDLDILKKQKESLILELEKIKNGSESKINMKHINITTGLSALDNLIMRIEVELAKQMAKQYEDVAKGHSSMKMLKLEAETKELELEVSKLLNLLADMKTRETKDKLNELYESISNKTSLFPLNDDTRYLKSQRLHDVKEQILNVDSIRDDFKKLKQLLQRTKDGYAGRPATFTIADEETSSEGIVAVHSMS